MILNFNDIKALTVGAVKIWQEGEGVRFLAITDKQSDFFESEGRGANARATTGIRLDFNTDSSYVAYVTSTTGKYELKIDGTLTNMTSSTEGERNFYSLPKDGKLHRVTLHLPSHGISGGIDCLELSDGAVFSRHEFDCKMLFIGDSITQGYNSKFDTLSFAYQVSDHFNAESIIQGTGGARFNAASLDSIDFAPDTVIAAYGTNDANRIDSLETIEKNCKDFLVKLKELFGNAKIIVITPVWRINYNIERPFGHISIVADSIRRIATELELHVVDGMKMIPANEFFMADDLHPNDLGFSLYAHNLIKELEALNI